LAELNEIRAEIDKNSKEMAKEFGEIFSWVVYFLNLPRVKKEFSSIIRKLGYFLKKEFYLENQTSQRSIKPSSLLSYWDFDSKYFRFHG
jgi:hypothetical protein